MSPRGRRPNTPGFGVTNGAALMVDCPRCKGKGKIEAKGITIGDRLRACREAAGKSQEEVAAMFGTSRGQVANLEGDRGRPGIETLVKAADAFDVTVDYLLGRVG